MSNNKILKNSFLISISAHFLVFALINPKINTRGFYCAGFPGINFVAVSLNKRVYKEDDPAPGLNRVGSAYDFFRKKIAALTVLPDVLGVDEIEKKPCERYMNADPELKKIDCPLAKYKNSGITGILAGRMLVCEPVLPQIPAWFKEKVAGPLECEMGVDSKGDVVFCHRITSTGSYALDGIGVEYVRNFKFVPSEQPFQYGKIKISFDGNYKKEENEKTVLSN